MWNDAWIALLVTIMVTAVWGQDADQTVTSSGSTTHRYVSRRGVRQAICGSRQLPCRHLGHVMSVASPGDVIHVEGNGAEVNDSDESALPLFSLCDNDYGKRWMSFNKSVTIVADDGRVRIGCEIHAGNDVSPDGDSGKEQNDTDTDSLSVSRLRTDPGAACDIRLRGVTFEHTVLRFASGCEVEIDDVIFRDASIVSEEHCHKIVMRITRSRWYGKHTCNPDTGCGNDRLNNLTCSDTVLQIHNSQFYQTTVRVETLLNTQLEMMHSEFTNAPDEIQFLGGLHFTFVPLAANILIHNCTFANLIHPTRIKSVINLYEAAILVKSISSPNVTTNAVVIIEHSRFVNNERGLTLIGHFKELAVRYCHFEKNMAMHAGGAMLVLIHTTLKIDYTTFIDNKAGEYRDDYPIAEVDGSFLQVGTEVHLNASCCTGVITLVGKGGAIRHQRGEMHIANCTFRNNTAGLLGGSIFVDIDGNSSIIDSSFENTEYHDHALQGDVIYSKGLMLINRVKLNIKTARNGLSLVRHSGDHWSLALSDVWIQCPVGYNLRTTNASAYGVTAQGLRRSSRLDELSYFCESCPSNKYSLDYGYLNYTLVYIKWAYYTLLINGSVPEPQYTGKYIHHEIECDDCPYGGHCVQGITSVANFWGHKHQNRSVKFQHCPKGYCCSRPKCPSINTCVAHRHGRLCGRCMEGYSEAIFSQICVPNDTCGSFWLWPLGAGVGILYTLFLLFQVDLKKFLFSKPLICVSMYKEKYPPKGQRALYETFMEGNHVTKNSTDHSHGHDSQEHADELLEFKAADSGFLIIVFYYFQDAILLHVKTVYASIENETEQMMKSILSGFFKLQLDLFQMVGEVCSMPDMSAVPNLVAKALIVPFVFVTFFVMYAVYKFIDVMGCHGKRKRKSKSTMHDDLELTHGSPEGATADGGAGGGGGGGIRKAIVCRLSSGFILALLFTFQKLGVTVFTLLNCVPVEGEMVLHIDGTVTCYQYWQYGVLAYAVTCVTPLVIVLMVGPSLLFSGHISLPQFFTACVCPLPFLIVWLAQRLMRKGKWAEAGMRRSRPLPEGTRAVIQLLQSPFNESKYGICWAGVSIGRRLILILFFTFVNDAFIRLLCMLLTLFIILLHHVHVQPYKDKHGNIAGTISAAALVTLGSINLVRAGFEAAEYAQTGPNAFLMKVFTEIENVLLLWMPLCIMCVVSLLFFTRLATAIFRRAEKSHRPADQ